METVQPKERLISEADYQEVKGLFVDYMAMDGDRYDKAEGGGARLKDVTQSVIDGDNDKLLELYERLCQDAISELKEALNLPFWKEVFKRIVENDGMINEATFEGIKRDVDSMGQLQRASHFINALGFDPQPQAFTKSPLDIPFDGISICDPQWDSKLKIAENLRHSFTNLIDIQSLLLIVYTRRPIGLRGLGRQIKALPYTHELLDSYAREVAGEALEEDVDMAEVLKGNQLLYDARFSGEAQGMPVEIITIGDVVLKNADMGAIIRAVKEPVTNTNRPGKITEVEMAKFAEDGLPYLTLLTEEVELRGERFVKVEIIDRGAQIDLNRIRESVGIGDFAFGDCNVAGLTRLLLARHVSVPLKNSVHVSTGIGLDTTITTVRKYGGEIYYTNMKGRGVRCMILIPVDGGKSGTRLSGLGISGAELDSVAAGIDENGRCCAGTR